MYNCFLRFVAVFLLVILNPLLGARDIAHTNLSFNTLKELLMDNSLAD